MGDARGHHHHADHPGRGERCQQAGGEQRCRRRARCRRRGGPAAPASASRSIRTSGRAGQPAATEHLVVAVGGEEQAEHHPHDERARGRRGPRPGTLRDRRRRDPGTVDVTQARPPAGRKADRGQRASGAAVRRAPARAFGMLRGPDRRSTPARSRSPSPAPPCSRCARSRPAWPSSWVIDHVIVPRFEDGLVATATVLTGVGMIIGIGLLRAAGVVVRRTFAGTTQWRIAGDARPVGDRPPRPPADLVASAPPRRRPRRPGRRRHRRRDRRAGDRFRSPSAPC